MKAKRTKTPAAARAPLSRRRRLVFYAIAVALPFLGLVLLEAVLRLGGAGYPTGYFLRANIQGREVYIDNAQFTRRYFPPGLARSPQPVAFATHKAAGTIRVFVLGESAAMGDPEPAYGFPRILELMLRDAWPGRQVEVINVSITAINSHVVRDVARDCADKEGDFWLVYMGNNEVVGPYGAGTVFGRQTPPLGVIRASLAAKSLRLGQCLGAGLEALQGSRKPAEWGGMEMFLRQQVPEDDPRMARVYAHFESNLREILRHGQRAGARVIVSTVASNLKDSPPFGSADLSSHTNGPLAEWQKRLTAGIAAQTAGNFPEALKLLDGMTRYFSNSAAAWFHAGRCQAGVSNFTAARQSLERARDLDTLRFRADSRLNGLIRLVATNSPGVQFLDGAERMAQQSPDGLPGDELFYEHVHFHFAGNYLLARAFAEQIVGPTNVAAVAVPDEYARRLALTDFDRYRVLDEVRQRLRQPPFSGQYGTEARDERLQKELTRLRPANLAEGLAAAQAIYEQAIARAPGDWVLRENYATLLQDHNQPTGAETQWRQVIALLPHDERAYYSLANVLDTQGKSAESLTFFHEALRRRPRSFEARNGLGLALVNQGQTNAGLDQFRQALKINPAFAEARVNLGQTLARQGHFDEALAAYAEVLRMNSNNVAARVNLGKTLAVQGHHARAAAEYRAALRVQPDHAVAHYNLGNALSALGDPGATAEYATAVRMQPDFVEAHYNLGLAYSKEGRLAEARAAFSAVVKLSPSFTEARLNLGVSLAKERRFAEAMVEFQEVLKLSPGHAEAQRFLDLARGQAGQ